MVIKISKSNGVSIGAHPSFNDPENFGRKKINLSSSEITKLITTQYEILQKIAQKHGENVTHIKPHGALNNMACEDFDLANTIAKSINNIDKKIIFLVPTGSQMEIAAKKLNMKIACEIDSVCIHGDNESSLATAKSIKENLLSNGLILKPLNKMKKFN